MFRLNRTAWAFFSAHEKPPRRHSFEATGYEKTMNNSVLVPVEFKCKAAGAVISAQSISD
jgi:hypothetical protein